MSEKQSTYDQLLEQADEDHPVLVRKPDGRIEVARLLPTEEESDRAEAIYTGPGADRSVRALIPQEMLTEDYQARLAAQLGRDVIRRERRGEGSSLWDYTENADPVVWERIHRESLTGAGEVRPTIGRDCRINGGVYEGRYGGEAIVVDREAYPEGYLKAMNQVLDRVRRPDGSVDRSKVLGVVYSVVTETMRYDQSAVDSIFLQAGGENGVKIALEVYIRLGVGVCRHQALMAAQLLEGLADGDSRVDLTEPAIKGRVSIDRNATYNDRDDKYDGHAWVRYTNSQGEVYILDIAQHRIGRLKDFMRERAQGGAKNIWDYGRPEDYKGYSWHPAEYENREGVIDRVPW